MDTSGSDVFNLQNEADGPGEEFQVFPSSKHQLVPKQLFSFFPALHTGSDSQVPETCVRNS